MKADFLSQATQVIKHWTNIFKVLGKTNKTKPVIENGIIKKVLKRRQKRETMGIKNRWDRSSCCGLVG